MKSFMPKEADIKREWFVVDAAEKPLGRMAVVIANKLRGKDKPTFTPHVDTGAFVVVLNADKVRLTGAKEQDKTYQTFSGYPSGLKGRNVEDMREKHPERIVRMAVKGMLPKNHSSVKILKRLKIYVGSEHPHRAQNPQKMELNI